MEHKPKVEYFDVLDENGNQTGTAIPRSEVHKTGAWHACIHAWIFNKSDNGEVQLMLQRREKKKESYPFHFDISSAGHLSSGETALVCLIRELYEELGIIITLNLPDSHNAEVLDKISHDYFDSTITDPALLHTPIVNAMYVTTQQNKDFSSLPTPLEYPITISTQSNPQYQTRSKLIFCGRFRQQHVVGADYIDNEFAYVFFIAETFVSPDDSSCINATTDDEDALLCPGIDGQRDQSKTTIPQHHQLTFLDDEVDSIAYIPLIKYLRLQRELTDEKAAKGDEDNTQFAAGKETCGNDIDILNKDWLVPITSLDQYVRDVFVPMQKFLQ